MIITLCSQCRFHRLAQRCQEERLSLLSMDVESCTHPVQESGRMWDLPGVDDPADLRRCATSLRVRTLESGARQRLPMQIRSRGLSLFSCINRAARNSRVVIHVGRLVRWRWNIMIVRCGFTPACICITWTILVVVFFRPTLTRPFSVSFVL